MNFVPDIVIPQLLTNFIKNIERVFVNFTKDQLHKLSVDSNLAFASYLKNTYAKNSKVRSLLSDNVPFDLLDIFEPVQFSLNNEIINSDDINNVLGISQFVIIRGIGGVGKSTTMKYFFLNELQKKDLVPVLFELKNLNLENTTLETEIANSMKCLGFTLDDRYLKYALQSGCFLFLLDGYDELPKSRRFDVCNQITNFCDSYSNNFYIISTRPDDSLIALSRFTTLETLPLTLEKAINLISRINCRPEITKKFVVDLDKSLYRTHKSFASNPLLLTIMLRTYEYYANIPQKLHIFYSNAFETLFFRHDWAKGGYLREKSSKLSLDTFRRILSRFCFQTYKISKIEFMYDEISDILSGINRKSSEKFNVDDYIDDLLTAVCILYRDGLDIRFTHRSFQEYFTALYLKELSDEILRKAVHNIINSDDIFDEQPVLKMLYDMNPDRFEQVILLPIAEELESLIKNEENKFDAILQNVMNSVGINKSSNGELGLSAITIQGNINNDYSMLFDYSFYYKKSDDIPPYHSNNAELLLLRLTDKTEQRYRVKDAICDHELYEYIKKSWISSRIDAILNMSSIIRNKMKDQLNEVDEISSDCY